MAKTDARQTLKATSSNYQASWSCALLPEKPGMLTSGQQLPCNLPNTNGLLTSTKHLWSAWQQLRAWCSSLYQQQPVQQQRGEGGGDRRSPGPPPGQWFFHQQEKRATGHNRWVRSPLRHFSSEHACHMEGRHSSTLLWRPGRVAACRRVVGALGACAGGARAAIDGLCLNGSMSAKGASSLPENSDPSLAPKGGACQWCASLRRPTRLQRHVNHGHV